MAAIQSAANWVSGQCLANLTFTLYDFRPFSASPAGMTVFCVLCRKPLLLASSLNALTIEAERHSIHRRPRLLTTLYRFIHEKRIWRGNDSQGLIKVSRVSSPLFPLPGALSAPAQDRRQRAPLETTHGRRTASSAVQRYHAAAAAKTAAAAIAAAIATRKIDGLVHRDHFSRPHSIIRARRTRPLS